MIINSNISSLNSQRKLAGTSVGLSTTMERLSSGLRINSAKDDAAGLSISERMTAQINGLNQARRNANDGISVSQTAEGALQTSGDILQRIRTLAVQSANDTNSTADRNALQAEVSQLLSEFDRVANTTQFNGLNLLNGDFSKTQFQVGANANQTITFGLESTKTTDMGNFALKGLTNSTNAMIAAQSVYGDSALAAGAGSASSSAYNQMQTQTLTLRSKGLTATVDISAGLSAKDVANRINSQQNLSGGITARAETYAFMGFGAGTAMGSSGAGTAAGSNAGAISFNLNGTAIQATSNNMRTDLDGLVTAINDVSGTTGVTAQKVDLPGSSGSYRIQLFAADGRDITIGSAAVSIQSGGSATNASLMQLQGAYDNNGTIVAAAGTAPAGSSANNIGVQNLGSTSSNRNSSVGGRVMFTNDTAYTVETSVSSNGGIVASGAGLTFGGSKTDTLSTVNISTSLGANKALEIVDAVIARVSSTRSKLGALQNRFQMTIENLQTSSENLSASRSRIRDADFAEETSNLSRWQVLQQAGTAMLSQANQRPQEALQLLR